MVKELEAYLDRLKIRESSFKISDKEKSELRNEIRILSNILVRYHRLTMTSFRYKNKKDAL
jgi:hypothetical protein